MEKKSTLFSENHMTQLCCKVMMTRRDLSLSGKHCSLATLVCPKIYVSFRSSDRETHFRQFLNVMPYQIVKLLWLGRELCAIMKNGGKTALLCRIVIMSYLCVVNPPMKDMRMFYLFLYIFQRAKLSLLVSILIRLALSA